jgi:cytochrome c-type biogenesis protein CcmH/NrfG
LRLLGAAAVAGSRQRGEPLRRGLVTGAAAGLTALLVQDVVDFNLHVPSNALVFAFLMALVASARGSRAASGAPAVAGLGVALIAIGLAAATSRNPPPPLVAWQESAQRAASLPGDRRLRLERTEKGLTEYLQARPGDAHAWLLLGWTRLAVGDRAAARELLEHARALDPANPHVAARARELAP